MSKGYFIFEYINNRANRLKSFRTLNNDEFLDILLNFLNVSGFFNEERKREVMGSYAYTPDNFIKVVLILSLENNLNLIYFYIKLFLEN